MSTPFITVSSLPDPDFSDLLTYPKSVFSFFLLKKSPYRIRDNGHRSDLTLRIPPYAIHIAIWMLVLLVHALFFRNAKFDTGLPAAFYIITTVLHIGLFYLNVYVLYARLATRRGWPIYLLFVAAVVPGLYRLKLFVIMIFNPQFIVTEDNRPVILFPPIPFLLASFIFIFIRTRLSLERNEKAKQAELLASELKFLRSQISPHFLFNVMANLVSMARAKSELLETTLIRFSEMLRYTLYDTNKEKFPLSKEVEYLVNYIELQKLRVGDDVQVSTEIRIADEDLFIEPMLLIPFVENAFKHGLGLLHDPFINLRLIAAGGRLIFTVSNNFTAEVSAKDHNSGIGLSNVKNRLHLLYGTNYRLHIDNAGGIYNVELEIELARQAGL